jgi:A/G-specific adenine glycosylase
MPRRAPTRNSKPGTRNLVSPLLRWFARAARDLPWRRTRDPYAIWISEIMLQQTQVKTVIPYWDRWMRELPDMGALATAKPERVLKLWEGLGYYTRARNLQRAAQRIVALHGGVFPRGFDDILALPGVGRYTAGAVSSIAFDEPRPILDGNVIRVLTRLFGIADDPREKQTNARLWQIAEELVTQAGSKNCSALNQALMELGALVCTPRSPQCGACPLRRRCDARASGRTEVLPNLGARAQATERHVAAFVFERGGKFLVRQRPAEVVNGLLWEFPNHEVKGEEGATASALLTTKYRVRSANAKPLIKVRHSITRYRIVLQAFHVELRGGAAPRERRGRWLPLEGLDALPLTSAHRKVWKALARLSKEA